MLFRSPPHGHHVWAQTDRLSIAYTFYECGMDFFHPRTYQMSSGDQIAGTEFPLPAYLAAAGGFVFGKTAIPGVFQLLNIGTLFAACVYLSSWFFRKTGNFVLSLSVALWWLSAPIVAFYTATYISDTFAQALIVIGFLKLTDGILYTDKKAFWWALFWLSLASLLKVSGSFYWLAGVVLVVWTMRKQTVFVLQWLAASAAVGVVFIAQVAYMRYLNETYQSGVFLTKMLPLKGSVQEILYYTFYDIFFYWKFDYFNYFHYLILGIGFLTLLKSVFSQKNSELIKILLSILTVMFVAGATIFALMGQQFRVHDYYILVAFYPFWVFLFVFANLQLHYLTQKLAPKYPNNVIIITTFMLILVGLGVNNTFYKMQERYAFSPEGCPDWLFRHEPNADLTLPKNAGVAVFNGGPNASFCYLHHKGIMFNTNVIPPIDTVLATMNARKVSFCVLNTTQLATYYADSIIDKHFTTVQKIDERVVLKLK